jgi:hypothetical protein
MTETTTATEPLPPAEGTYFLADDVNIADAVTVGFVAGREQKASHLFKDGRWVRLVLKDGGVVAHEVCETVPEGAPVGVPRAGQSQPVLISNAREVREGLERAKPVQTVPQAINHGPGVGGVEVPAPAADSAANTALVAPSETAVTLTGGVIPTGEGNVVGIRKAPDRPRTGKGQKDAVAEAAPLKPQ